MRWSRCRRPRRLNRVRTMAEPRFAVGDLVRTRPVDPPHHTRIPRYTRGHVGEVVEVQGTWQLAEFGLTLPADTEIFVHDTSAESRHMVLPVRPAGSDRLDEAQLAALVTREGLIGTASV